MSLTGESNGRPLRDGAPIVHVTDMLFEALAISSALFER